MRGWRNSHTNDHAERKAEAPSAEGGLLEVAQGAPEGLQDALVAEGDAALHVGVGGANDLGHHFTVSRHRGPAESDFFVGGGGGGSVRVHMGRRFENFEGI